MSKDEIIAALLDKLAQADLIHATVARQLHDEAGQTVAALGMHLQSIRQDLRLIAQSLEPNASTKREDSSNQLKLEESAAALTEVQKLLSGVMETLRQTSGALGKVPVRRVGLHRSLEGLARSSETTSQMKCQYKGDPSVRVEPETGVRLYRIAEEAVAFASSNRESPSTPVEGSRGGAPAPTEVGITLEFIEQKLQLEIQIRGTGTAITLSESLSFLRMKYWANEAAMQIFLDSSAGNGTIIKVFPNTICRES